MKKELKEIVLPRLVDAHVHLRDDDEITEMVLSHLYDSGFGRIVPIFNYKKPIETARQIKLEQERLQRLGCKVNVTWSIMLTGNSTKKSIADAYAADARVIKLMPDGLTTNAGYGIDWNNIHDKFPCFSVAEKFGMSVKVHLEGSLVDARGNPTTPHIWREYLPLAQFDAIARAFPDLIFVIAHISTRRVLRYLLNEAPPNVVGEITIHHLLRTFFDIYDGSPIPKADEWCMPIYKYPEDKEALIEAATSGSNKLFYGSDKAPHRYKNSFNPPAGVYAGLTDVCLLAQLFEERGKLHNLKQFMSDSWNNCFETKPESDSVTLVKEEWMPPSEVNGVQIFGGGQKLEWRVESVLSD